MSRHRTIRNNKNLTDDYDVDDCFGSVEDDYCVSPSAEQFMYDRSKQANIASFMTEPDIVEDVEEVEDMPSSYKVPHLSDLDAAKLISCAETIRNVVGETYPESELNRKIIEFKFNTEAVLNSILNDETAKNVSVSAKQPQEKTFDAQPGSKFKNFSSDSARATMPNNTSTDSDKKCNLEKGCDKGSQGFSSLSTMMTKDVESLDKTSNPLSSLAGLSAFHLKMSDKKPSLSSGFSIPKVNFNNAKPSDVSPDETPGFSSLASLTAHHLNKSNDKKPSGFIIPKLGPKNIESKKSDSPSFDSLAELTAHHLNISNDKNESSQKHSGFVIPKIGPKDKESSQSNSPSFGCLAELTAHHLTISNKSTDALPSGFVIAKKTDEDKFTIPKLSIKQEKGLDKNTAQNSSKLVLEDISNLCIDEKFDPNKVIKREPIDTPMQEVFVKTEKSDSPKSKTIHCNNKLPKSLESSLEAIKKECSQYRAKAIYQRKSVSSFGKVICKSFSRKAPYLKKSVNTTPTIAPFDFSSPSPDSIVLARIRRGVVV